MQVIINGDEKEIKVADLAGLVDSYDLKKSTLVIEHNGEIIKKEEWEHKKIKEHDNIELVTMMGGG